ncbi:MAG: hypothetical protein OXE87_13750 [Chloroflexi bacterium]|nr:hypothetical protein [Chloroflexota bacterium]
MESNNFVERLHLKLERVTNRDVQLSVTDSDPNFLEVDLEAGTPKVVVGSNVYEYPGFARMCLEYAAASINKGRHIGELEFHLLLARN